MAFNHLKKLLLVTLFTSGILSNSVMASYVSDGLSWGFHPLSDATLDLSDTDRIPRLSNFYGDEGIRITLRVPGTGSVFLNANNGIVMGPARQLIGGRLVLYSNNLTLHGGIKAVGGTIQIAGRSALPVLTPDRLRPINWQSFNLDGSGNATISTGGDISLRAPVGGSGNVIISNGGGISLLQPNSGIISGNLIIANRGDVSLRAPVPLPAASILLGSGLLGLISLVAGRRRR